MFLLHLDYRMSIHLNNTIASCKNVFSVPDEKREKSDFGTKTYSSDTTVIMGQDLSPQKKARKEKRICAIKASADQAKQDKSKSVVFFINQYLSTYLDSGYFLAAYDSKCKTSLFLQDKSIQVLTHDREIGSGTFAKIEIVFYKGIKHALKTSRLSVDYDASIKNDTKQYTPSYQEMITRDPSEYCNRMALQARKDIINEYKKLKHIHSFNEKIAVIDFPLALISYRNEKQAHLNTLYLDNANSFLKKGGFKKMDLIEEMISLTKSLILLHQHHIFHGDIKGSNIFVSKDNHFVFGDFGGSYIRDYGKGFSKHPFSFTAGFLSLEDKNDYLMCKSECSGKSKAELKKLQAQFEAINARRDVYALGKTFRSFVSKVWTKEIPAFKKLFEGMLAKKKERICLELTLSTLESYKVQRLSIIRKARLNKSISKFALKIFMKVSSKGNVLNPRTWRIAAASVYS